MSSSIDRDRVATAQDISKALVALSSLPKRATVDAQLEFNSYVVALERVKAFALAGAVRAILQNALGHTFFPSPPELRGQCDVVMRAYSEELAKEQHRQRLAEERAELAPISRPASARQRVAAIYKQFLDQLRGTSEEQEVAALRAKYGEDVLSRIPDGSTPPAYR